MKLKNLLSIISIIIWMFSCNTNSSNSKTEKLNIHNDSVLKADTTHTPKEKINKPDRTIIKQVNRKNKVKENKMNKRLEVIIDGKVYYKKSINDSPVNISPKGYKPSKYLFEYINHKVYDIRTGKFLNNYVEVE